MLSFQPFFVVFPFRLTRIGHCVPRLLLRPLPRQLRWKEREGEVWTESSRLRLSSAPPSLYLHNLHSLRALLFLHQPSLTHTRSVLFRVPLLNLWGKEEGPCFWVDWRKGGFSTFYVFRRSRLVPEHSWGWRKRDRRQKREKMLKTHLFVNWPFTFWQFWTTFLFHTCKYALASFFLTRNWNQISFKRQLACHL